MTTYPVCQQPVIAAPQVANLNLATPRVASPYVWKQDGIYLQDGDDQIRLSNFTAEIIADVMRTDGEDAEALFEIIAYLHDEAISFVVPARSFDGLSWVAEHLGGRAIIEPVSQAKAHLRTAIRRFSRTVAKRPVFTHTGWAVVNGQRVFLNAGTAIGMPGVASVEVDLPAALSRYVLPEVPAAAEAIGAARASLGFLDLADDRITIPVLAAVYRSVLGNCDFSLHLSGRTGVYKSSLAAVALQHFGAGHDASNFPASWASTGNALEATCFSAKDVLVVADDFVPGEVEAQRKAERLFRAQGNIAGRARLTGGAKLQSGRAPRGLLLSTGEDAPLGRSLLSRIVVVDVAPGDVDLDLLTRCQATGRFGGYAQAMSGFVHWLIPRYADLMESWEDQYATLRRRFELPQQHGRTASNVANLLMGFNEFLDYARDIDAISAEEQMSLENRAIAAFSSIAESQTSHQVVENEPEKFIRLLRTAFLTGGAHLKQQRGGKPRETGPWGWTTPGLSDKATSSGPLIGWIGVDGFEETDDIYLDPNAAYKAAQRAASSASERIAITPRALFRQLDEQSLLVSTEYETRGTKTVRVMIWGIRKSVLHLSKDVFRAIEEGKKAEQD